MIRRIFAVVLLHKIIDGTNVRFSETFDIDGRAMFTHACERGLEGVVPKVRDGRCQTGRTSTGLGANQLLVDRGGNDIYPSANATPTVLELALCLVCPAVHHQPMSERFLRPLGLTHRTDFASPSLREVSTTTS